jgi:hypothetical protein
MGGICCCIGGICCCIGGICCCIGGICCCIGGICCCMGIIGWPPNGGMILMFPQNGQFACTIWFMAGMANAWAQAWQDHVTSCCG